MQVDLTKYLSHYEVWMKESKRKTINSKFNKNHNISLRELYQKIYISS